MSQVKVQDFRKYFQSKAPFSMPGGATSLMAEMVDPAYEQLNHFMSGTANDHYKFGSVTEVRTKRQCVLFGRVAPSPGARVPGHLASAHGVSQAPFAREGWSLFQWRAHPDAVDDAVVHPNDQRIS